VKIALVHEYLAQSGGAEKVLHAFHEIWPDAPIFVWFYDPSKFRNEFANADVRTSFIQKMPGVKKNYQWYLPLMPTATERHRLDEFDVVLSSSSMFAKGVLTRPGSLHICYCHTPPRYLWTETHEYIENLKYNKFIKRIVLPPLISRLRLYDKLSADRVDMFLANSETVRSRIHKFYRRESRVVYPPVETDRFKPAAALGDYYLTGGRLMAYKRFDIVVKTFNRLPHLKLKVFGTGPEEEKLKNNARSNITFVGNITDDEKAQLYAHCLAFIHPQVEDFGITPVESLASGRPVIAYREGGASETIEQGKTGVFFNEQNWESLLDVLIHFSPHTFSPELLKEYASKFNKKQFQENMKRLVEDAWEETRRGLRQTTLI